MTESRRNAARIDDSKRKAKAASGAEETHDSLRARFEALLKDNKEQISSRTQQHIRIPNTTKQNGPKFSESRIVSDVSDARLSSRMLAQFSDFLKRRLSFGVAG